MEPKMWFSGIQNHEKPATRAPQKPLKKRPRKVGPGPHFDAKNGLGFRIVLVPFSSPGLPWGQTGPRVSPRAPRMVPDPTFNDFSKFFNGFVVAFCVRPLVCHHVYLQLFRNFFLVDFGVPPLVCHHQNKKHGGRFRAQRTEILLSAN